MELKIEHFQNCHDATTKTIRLQRNNQNSYKRLTTGNAIIGTENRLEKYHKTKTESKNVVNLLKKDDGNDNSKNDDVDDDDDDDDDNDDNAMEELINDSADDFDQEVVKCIFLCKFHATAGPKIAAQVPNNYISKEIFDTVSRYVIPKVQLQRSFLSVSLLGKKILGYPVRIDNKQYARNAFHFNFCFVFAPTTHTVVYEAVVRKLTEYMLSMELSSKLLSQCDDDTAQLTRLIKLLTQIRTDLNRRKMCLLLEGSTIIPLCVVPYYKEPPLVKPYLAALLKNEFHKYVRSQWDLATQRILPYINGYNHIQRIAMLADVTLGIVLDCIKHLVMLGVAILVPVFQYSNIYRPTPKLAQLAKCKEMQERCIEQCSRIKLKHLVSKNSAAVRRAPRAKVRDVFRIFASMAHGATFGEVCVRFNPAALNINEKEMVLFGQIEGLIRRVDKYPITVQRNLFYDDEPFRTTGESSSTEPSPEVSQQSFHFNNCGSHPLPRGERPGKSHAHHHSQSNISNYATQRSYHHSISSTSKQRTLSNQQNQIYHHYSGLKSFDEICMAREISSQQLESQLAKDRHVIVLLR